MRSSWSEPYAMPEMEVDIRGLAAQGDGIADASEGPQFVPFALPGERVRIAAQGLPDVISAPSPDRIAPLCRHFGVCGGCAAQHMSATLYSEWKRGVVVEAFRQRGLEAPVAPLLRVPPASRRRAVFAARRSAGVTTLGYHRRRSHDVFALEECPVLVPAIVEKLEGLRAIASSIGGDGEARITVLATPAGLDVDVALERTPGAATAARWAGIAGERGIARITVEGEAVVARATPSLPVGNVPMVVPPGAFLQAVAEAEAAITRCALAAVGQAKRIADLFAGVGTLTFPLARKAAILAIDSDKQAIAALGDAARRAQGLKPVETRVRDLFRDPLSPRELDAFDAAVFDPPRAGAKAQADALAKSKVPVVVAVSCNPATLARDARVLVDGGYRLEGVTPIDQFLFAAHVEAVAVFRRGR